jgi:hypothetical protein
MTQAKSIKTKGKKGAKEAEYSPVVAEKELST